MYTINKKNIFFSDSKNEIENQQPDNFGRSRRTRFEKRPFDKTDSSEDEDVHPSLDAVSHILLHVLLKIPRPCPNTNIVWILVSTLLFSLISNRLFMKT